jgi:hypothetical protein
MIQHHDFAVGGAAGAVLLLFGSLLHAETPRYADPARVDADFVYQGEYAGELSTEDGQAKYGVQVIALGHGKFQGVAFVGGLPGDGWNGESPLRGSGELVAGAVKLKTEQGTGTIQDGLLAVWSPEGREMGKLRKISRQSPTLGQKPPAGAVVLFDGAPESLDGWQNGRRTEDGLLMEGTTSKRTFRDHRVHFEFRLAYQPEDRGQGRSNSGIYLQGRYEVQILDSFGLDPRDNECGGIYSVKVPSVNMCYPPLSWQTYDIDFTAAKYDAEGKLVANPRISVRHNGVPIHDAVELPGNRSTTAAPNGPGPTSGPIFLQNHGCPLRYRNIWVVEQ